MYKMHKTKANSKILVKHIHFVESFFFVCFLIQVWSSMTIFLLKHPNPCTKTSPHTGDFPALCKAEPFLYCFFVFLSLDKELIRDPSLLVSKSISFHFTLFLLDLMIWWTLYFLKKPHHYSKAGVSSSDLLSLLRNISIDSFSEWFCVFQRECFVSLNVSDFPKRSHHWTPYIPPEFRLWFLTEKRLQK